MKHGRTLISALDQLERDPDRRADPAGATSPGDELTPLRPGAFAAWAARRPSEPESRVERPARRVGRRAPAGPPAI